MIVDAQAGFPVRGWNYDLDLDAVEAWLADTYPLLGVPGTWLAERPG